MQLLQQNHKECSGKETNATKISEEVQRCAERQTFSEFICISREWLPGNLQLEELIEINEETLEDFAKIRPAPPCCVSLFPP